jgi:hypothetical protein
MEIFQPKCFTMVRERSPDNYGPAMIAELRRLHSPDVLDLPTWVPEGEEFAILLQIMAGPQGSPGEESFDITLCTPTWVKRQAEEEMIVSGRFLLIIAHYDYGLVYRYIATYLSKCSGDEWPEVAEKIARLGHWEFEDYRE